MTKKYIKLRGLCDGETADLMPFDGEGMILLGYRGSIAHNMYIPQNDPNSIDDKDIMGVYVAPTEHYVGLQITKPWEKMKNEWDVVCYEVKKYFKLLLKMNPNVLSLLWVPDKHIIYSSYLGDMLRANRELFSSKQAYYSFGGYAHSQLHKMTHYAHKGYMGKKRKELVDEFGYDTKNAAHLIRLLRMGIEFLNTGELVIERPDAKQLLEIKSGEWSLEKVVEEADRLFPVLEEEFRASKLPATPDREGAEKLLMEIVCRAHGWR